MGDGGSIEPRDAAHEARWRTFEVVVGVPGLVALALQWLAPWSLASGPQRLVLASIGVALLIAGVALVVKARRAFRAHGQPTDPGRPTSALVTTDVFAISRNPLYLGGVAALLGIALLFDLPWLIVLLVPATVACHYLLIVPEERYLRRRFGTAYADYAARVGRWIGRTK